MPATSDPGTFSAQLGVPLYLDRAFRGVFVEPGFIAYRAKLDEAREGEIGGPTASVGYQYLWSNGINVAASIGGAVNLKAEDNLSFGEGRLVLDGSLQLGKAF